MAGIGIAAAAAGLGVSAASAAARGSGRRRNARGGAPRLFAGTLALAWAVLPAGAAEPVMVQCGRAYQAAKAAGTLDGAEWNAYRESCAARLKSSSAPSAAVPPTLPAAVPPAPSSAPPPAAGAPAAPGGMAAMHARQKQCGAEWRAEKAALVAETPGLTWPTYWSRCNARLKAAKG